MKKLITTAFLALSLALTAPAADASITIEEQRAQMNIAMRDLQFQFAAEKQDLLTQLAAETPGTQAYQVVARLLQRHLARQAFLNTSRANLNTYSQTKLNNLILYFDLPVSLA